MALGGTAIGKAKTHRRGEGKGLMPRHLPASREHCKQRGRATRLPVAASQVGLNLTGRPGSSKALNSPTQALLNSVDKY